MSTTTIYKCDKCGAEQLNRSQFWTVGVKAYCIDNPYGGSYEDAGFVSAAHKMEVCRPCLESFGINVQKREAPPVQPTPSLEDLIREIVRQEIPQS